MPFLAPELYVGPKEAAEIIRKTIDEVKTEDFCFIGSSLGGFYATKFAEDYGKKAVLLNPAVRPWNFIEDKVGEHEIAQIGKKILVTPEFGEELKDLYTDGVKKTFNFMTFLGDADEVLDWREGLEFYKKTNVRIVRGGDHRFSDFEPLVKEIMSFLR